MQSTVCPKIPVPNQKLVYLLHLVMKIWLKYVILQVTFCFTWSNKETSIFTSRLRNIRKNSKNFGLP